MIGGAVLLRKKREFWLQLQFFSSCCVGINYCNVASFRYRIISFRIGISGSALGSAPKGALGNRSARGGASEAAQGNPGRSRECSRECSSC